MAAIFQTTFLNEFSWTKMYKFRLKFHWSLFPRVQLTISQHWFRWWLGADQATSHYLNQWWLIYWRIYASLGLNELIFGKESQRAYMWRLLIYRLWPVASHFDPFSHHGYSSKVISGCQRARSNVVRKPPPHIASQSYVDNRVHAMWMTWWRLNELGDLTDG